MGESGNHPAGAFHGMFPLKLRHDHRVDGGRCNRLSIHRWQGDPRADVAAREDTVTTELLAVLVTTVAAVLAATVTIIGVVVSGQRSVRSEVRAIGERIGALEQRIEGVIETLQTILLRGLDRDKDAA